MFVFVKVVLFRVFVESCSLVLVLKFWLICFIKSSNCFSFSLVLLNLPRMTESQGTLGRMDIIRTA